MRHLLLMILLLIGTTGTLFPHCQIPCGIYDDERQFKSLIEHATTIEKSMTSIHSVKDTNPQQHVRWVHNKETHATKIQDSINHYFLAQRIKPAQKSDKKAYQRYVQLLTKAHSVLRAAMVTKQKSTIDSVTQLKEAIGSLKNDYFSR